MTDIERMTERVRIAADAVRARLGEAEIGVVLGTGLGGFVDHMQGADSMAYAEILGFPVPTVQGHAGRWWRGTLHGKSVYMLQGRFHMYEGRSMEDITLYVRMMKLLGVRVLILTNAAGCVNAAWQAGDLMLFTDFINFSGLNPLIGPNADAFGPRFPDLCDACDPALVSLCEAEAAKLGLTNVRKGVYMWFSGPSFETPAEIRMARILGADAVGMSTVPEIIAARHCGLRVMAVSCMTNMAAGMEQGGIDHTQVLANADRAKDAFTKLLDAAIKAV